MIPICSKGLAPDVDPRDAYDPAIFEDSDVQANDTQDGSLTDDESFEDTLRRITEPVDIHRRAGITGTANGAALAIDLASDNPADQPSPTTPQVLSSTARADLAEGLERQLAVWVESQWAAKAAAMLESATPSLKSKPRSRQEKQVPINARVHLLCALDVIMLPLWHFLCSSLQQIQLQVKFVTSLVNISP